MDEQRLAQIEACYERFATDQDMPTAEWEALQLQVLKDHYDLQQEVRRLRAYDPDVQREKEEVAARHRYDLQMMANTPTT